MREHVVDQKVDPQLSVNKQRWKADSIRYVVASTPYMLSQYYQLLEDIGQNYISKGFKVTPQEHLINNLYGAVIVAINGYNQVIGGARVIISSPNNRCDLPLETSSFKLNNLFPEMNLDQVTYAEWGRFIAYPGIANKKTISENIAHKCVMYALEKGASYLFGLPILCMKERYEQIFSQMGLSFNKLLPPGAIPKCSTSPDIDFYLAVTDLTHTNCIEHALVDKNISVTSQ